MGTTFTLSNAGPGVLHWSIPEFSDLVVEADPAFGSIDPGAAVDVRLGVSAAELVEGNYTTELRIAHNDPARADILLLLELSVFTVRVGDVNADDRINAQDIIFLVHMIYREGQVPFPGTGDANCDSGITVPDILYLVEYIYKNGPEPGCL